jgi:hypothetical protein
MNHEREINRTEFANLKFFYEYHLIPFPEGRVLVMASPSGKKSKVYMRSKVIGFECTRQEVVVLEECIFHQWYLT